MSAEALLQQLEWTVLRRLDGLLQGDHKTLFITSRFIQVPSEVVKFWVL